MMIRLLFLHTFLLAAICNFCFAEFDVWPVPQHISIIENENKISISKNFRFVLGEEMKDLDGTTIANNRDEISGAILAVNMPFTLTTTVPTADSTSLGFNLVWRQAPCGGYSGGRM